MAVNRRRFFQLTGATALGVVLIGRVYQRHGTMQLPEEGE